MKREVDIRKRDLISGAAATGIVTTAALILPSRAAARSNDEGEKTEVTPPEDLMREHGVLDRVLLVYEAGLHKFAAKQDFDTAVITNAAEIVRDFIHNYHEESEERAVFPRFKKAGKMVDLVDTLLVQHKAGRGVTETILRTAPRSRQDGDDRRQLTDSVRAFITMYRPHAAREDTELFPMLRSLVSAHEFGAMAEDFERKERELFGDDGFEMMTRRVADLERRIGIDDLSQFTPRQ